ncbi:cytochrome-c oxidase [Syntrophotalea acetylenivorans]|uniref:Cytochrome-c oxidase n=1 Tax=Syntrophotalea acetylenivorans TaxID=1842532 RepID=A0A1L3GS04_9BACT|nr:SCO family protein [Syntrophotalea acetylenivorans]APG28724.1 cytochrome-c oxidase [Syntrophotalea acetylenivorans]
MNCIISFARQISSSQSTLSLLTLILLAVLLILPAIPAGAEHPSAEADMNDRASMQHHDPPAEQQVPQHQHDHSAQAMTDNQVGIEERLGAFIPLDLTFQDENGQTVILRDLITGPTIIAPIYYSCPNVCAFLQADLARNLPAIKLQPDQDYRVLSISFDEKDTPMAARASRKTYMTAMGQPFPEQGWRFLTGEAAASKALTKAAGYSFLRQGNDFLHPVVIFVVTGEGRIVRYLHGTRMLPMDLTLALTEAREGRLGSTIRKVVRFCFNYDSQQKHYVFNLLRIAATVILITAGGFLLFLFISGRKR